MKDGASIGYLELKIDREKLNDLVVDARHSIMENIEARDEAKKILAQLYSLLIKQASLLNTILKVMGVKKATELSEDRDRQDTSTARGEDPEIFLDIPVFCLRWAYGKAGAWNCRVPA